MYMALLATALAMGALYSILRLVALENERAAEAVRQELAWIVPPADEGEAPEVEVGQAGHNWTLERRIAAAPGPVSEIAC
jgi:hypothetical protein